MNITFVGGGNMAAALIGGLLAKNFGARAIRVIDPDAAARERLSGRYGIACFADAAAAAPFGDVLVLAVKPQVMRPVAQTLAAHLHDELVLTIAAGIRLTDLDRWLGGARHLARCMPNTPALIGAGISGLYAAPIVDAAQRQQAQTILEAVGRVVWVDKEALLDPVTAVSGSGPAYVFYFIEAMQKAAATLGLSDAIARELVVDTFRGAAELAAQSDDAIGVLRERVTSKGGTTERALNCMRKDGVEAAIANAIDAACQRAREMGDELGRDE
jgi:pyrroline-5-carboxylate reductase